MDPYENSPPEVAPESLVLKRATEVFENTAIAKQWLIQPCPAIGGLLPVTLLITEAGLQQVVQALDAIEYGLPI